MSRREFLTVAAGVGVTTFATVSFGCVPSPPPVRSFSQSPRMRKFVTALPGLGPSAANEIGQFIPLATKTTRTFAGLATDTYDLAVSPFAERMHPDLPAATHFHGYHDLGSTSRGYLGGVIVAKRGTPVLLSMANQLPDRALVPTDPTVMAGPDGLTVGQLPLNRIATHLHGGATPWFSDGTPLQWYDPAGKTGPSFMNVPGTQPPAGTATYYYPLDQSARFAWYHDHAMGITRTNAYAGIASALLVIDDFELGLVNSGLLPDLVGTPLIIQDKSFVPHDILVSDPDWKWGAPGDLWYPHAYEANALVPKKPDPYGRWDWGPTADHPTRHTRALPPTSLVPEAFFDTIMVNGGVYPVATVPPKRVRFRVLNGSQARFLHLSLYPEDSSTKGEAMVGTPGPIMYQVGTEGGFLPAVAVHRNDSPLKRKDPESVDPAGPFNLLLAPAERADLVVDFNGAAPGSTFILYNDATAPFPDGDERNDYFTGDRNNSATGGAPRTPAGFGPNTRTLMKIVVGPGSGDTMPTSGWLRALDSKLRNNFLTGNQPGLLFHAGDPSVPAFPFTGTPSRKLTLNEDFDEFGRLIQTMGTFASSSKDSQGLDTWGLAYMADPTEDPIAGTTEVWQIFNLTGDTHPIHFHLVNVQLLQRQRFDGDPSAFKLVGPPRPPDPNEMGWKETVRMNPGEITTVAMKFDLPHLPTAEMTRAVSPRTGGHEYVWHCHILEHEEHDMMRPLIVR